jgi:hypothetical protein
MNSVPVNFGHVYQGMASAHGIIRDEDRHLVLEWQVSDAILGVIKSQLKQARIPLQDIESVRLSDHWFSRGAKIIILLRRLDTATEIPSLDSGRVVVNVAGKDREAAERLVHGLYDIATPSASP